MSVRLETVHTCTGCLEEKPRSEFYTSTRSNRQGAIRFYRRPTCKDCELAGRSRKSCLCRVCGDPVRYPGMCGFCREEATGERLTRPERPETATPRSTRQHRLATAAMSAGER